MSCCNHFIYNLCSGFCIYTTKSIKLIKMHGYVCFFIRVSCYGDGAFFLGMFCVSNKWLVMKKIKLFRF